MCGICLYMTDKNDFNTDCIEKKFKKISHRGPDASQTIPLRLSPSFNHNILMTFHRLSMIDVSDKSMQPFYYYSSTTNEKIYMMCNGEIYNYKKLIEEHNLNIDSNSDCAVIIPLYIKYGFRKMVELIHGEFAIILVSNYNSKISKIYAARDRIGVRPIFYFKNKNTLGICSELKGLVGLNYSSIIHPFPIATIMECTSIAVNDKVTSKYEFQQYYSFDFKYSEEVLREDQLTQIKNAGLKLLVEVVKERMVSDRPMCALLSGGLDSSTVAGIMSIELAKENKVLNTFCIGLKGGTDLQYAREVSDYIKSNHTEIIITVNDALDVIPDVIKAIESYDITSIRASVWQYIISKYISEKTDNKCVMVGEGPDELCQGYQYFKNAPSILEAHNESVRLVKELYMFDLLRVDRCMASFGLEARVPYLDHKFVDFYMSISARYRTPQESNIEDEKSNFNLVEKWLLREFVRGKNIIPESVVNRPKVALSDGTSPSAIEDSWFTQIKKHIDTLITDEEYQSNKKKYLHLQPISKESYYYRKKFEHDHGENNVNVINKYWLPSFCEDITDPSARILKVNKEIFAF